MPVYRCNTCSLDKHNSQIIFVQLKIKAGDINSLNLLVSSQLYCFTTWAKRAPHAFPILDGFRDGRHAKMAKRMFSII